MTCSACGAALPEGGNFCVECGQPRGVARCPGCSEPVHSARFCAQCGTQLDRASAGAATANGPVAEPPDRDQRVSPVPGIAGTERRVRSVRFC